MNSKSDFLIKTNLNNINNHGKGDGEGKKTGKKMTEEEKLETWTGTGTETWYKSLRTAVRLPEQQ